MTRGFKVCGCPNLPSALQNSFKQDRMSALEMDIASLHVLGTPLLLTDYDRLAKECERWALSDHCVALDFANTQIVTMRRHEPEFLNLTSSYDHFPPDGMPLIWC